MKRLHGKEKNNTRAKNKRKLYLSGRQNLWITFKSTAVNAV